MRKAKAHQLTIEIGKVSLPVTVSHDGEFWAEWEGTGYRSTTFKGLRVKLLAVVREDAKRCAVPALYLDYSGDWQDVTLIGIHADNRNVLFLQGDKAGTQQVRGHGGGRFFPVLSPAAFASRKALLDASREADKALRAWDKKHALHVGNVVRAAIGLPVEAEKEGDDDE